MVCDVVVVEILVLETFFSRQIVRDEVPWLRMLPSFAVLKISSRQIRRHRRAPSMAIAFNSVQKSKPLTTTRTPHP